MSYPIAVQSKLLKWFDLKEQFKSKSAIANAAIKEAREVSSQIERIEKELQDWLGKYREEEIPFKLLEVEGRLLLLQIQMNGPAILEMKKETVEKVLR